jgi:hypothetical protein
MKDNMFRTFSEDWRWLVLSIIAGVAYFFVVSVGTNR